MDVVALLSKEKRGKVENAKKAEWMNQKPEIPIFDRSLRTACPEPVRLRSG